LDGHQDTKQAALKIQSDPKPTLTEVGESKSSPPWTVRSLRNALWPKGRQVF
jgi:hypothetical protein